MKNMYRTHLIFMFGFLFSLLSYAEVPKNPKIVGLTAVRNDEVCVEAFLRSFAYYTDAIVVLDDASDDNTLEIVKSLQVTCNIECIIEKKVWLRDEKDDKNKLLEAGRKIGGTHFIILDSDEVFTANCAQDNWLRKKILTLKPGEVIFFPFIHVWDGIDYYRNDEQMNPFSCPRMNLLRAVFCDDGICNYSTNSVISPSKVIHVGRIPGNLKDKKGISTKDINFGVIHFLCANLENLKIKRAWYMFFELIHSNVKASGDRINIISRINKRYAISNYAALDFPEERIKTSLMSRDWLNYENIDFSCFTKSNQSRIDDILSWLKLYSPTYFNGLAIGDFQLII